MNDARQLGAGLLEILVVSAVLIILATQALPLTSKFMDRRRVLSVTNALYDDMRFAQSEALRRNATVYYGVTGGTSWCYGFSVNAGCNCATANSCELRSQSYASFQNTSMSTTATTGSFDPAVGGATAVSVTVSSLPATTLSRTARFNLGLAGLMSLCSPAGTGSIPDFAPC